MADEEAAWIDELAGEFLNLRGAADEVVNLLEKIPHVPEPVAQSMRIMVAYHCGQISYCRFSLTYNLSQEQKIRISEAMYLVSNYLLGLSTNWDKMIMSVKSILTFSS